MPSVESGEMEHKPHQWLASDFGKPELHKHLNQAVKERSYDEEIVINYFPD